MNFILIVRVLSIFILGNLVSCKRTRQVNSDNSVTISNKIGNPVALKNVSGDLKPCRRHQKRIASFIFPSSFPPFIPLCDSRGYYLPLQCYESSGYCWCVDKNGNMKHGTKTKGKIDCGLKVLQKPCTNHRLRSLKHQAKTRRPVFIPTCGKNGYYSPLQCTTGKKYCWCVDKLGHKKRGSHTKGLTDCSKPQENDNTNENLVDVFSARFDGPCSKHKKRQRKLLKIAKRNMFDPTCDEDGYYAQKQCHSGYCWCSDRNGKRISDSIKKGNVDCDSPLSGPTRPPCLIERLKGLKSSMGKKQFVPLCSPDGSYAPLQCDSRQGFCWCTDKWGKEVKNSRTKRTPKCLTNSFTTHKKQPCYELKKYIKQLPTVDNIHIPACKRSGLFKPLQCSRDNKYCWCVEQDGMEIRGTVTFGKPTECPERSMNMTYVQVVKARHGPCTAHKERRKKLAYTLRRNFFNPRCNEFGYYDSKQCHGKYCWCSDRNGKRMRGTRRKGDVDCVRLSRPNVKPCLANRLRALKISLAKKPYVPQCLPDGHYTPLQCNVHTGVCWCVDARGREVAGSKTKRTPNCFKSAFNSVDDGPCDILKSYVSKLPPNNKVNDPICEGSGFFRPAQCSKSNGFCWCVMHDGTEVQGSITFGKPDCYVKRSPAVPRLRGPCEEHLAHVNNMLFGERKHVYTPVCDDIGYYATHQCNNDTTLCWCADKYGSMIEGTRIKGKLPSCNEKVLKPCVAFNKKKNEEPAGVNDVYDAVCTEKGFFAPLQCNVNSGNCWCVDSMGKAVAGTTIYQRPYCGKEKRQCEIERRAILSNDKSAKTPPSCDVHGYYSRVQCDHSSDECWCSNSYGKETAGTRVKGMPICDQLPRPCDEHAATTLNNDNLFGVYTPQCDSQGYYSKVQCHKKTNVCWCSNKIGVAIPGTKTNGRPNCLFY